MHGANRGANARPSAALSRFLYFSEGLSSAGERGVQTFTWKVSADTVATVAHTRVATRRTLVQILRGESTALSDASFFDNNIELLAPPHGGLRRSP